MLLGVGWNMRGAGLDGCTLSHNFSLIKEQFLFLRLGQKLFRVFLLIKLTKDFSMLLEVGIQFIFICAYVVAVLCIFICTYPPETV